MKIRVHLKDPDTLIDAIDDAVNAELKTLGLDEEEQEAIRDIRVEKAMDVASEWFDYGEYLSVEIDTDTKTIRVLTTKERNE